MSSIDHLDRVREAAKGVVVTTVSPFKGDGLELDEKGARANLEALAASRVAAIVPSGNTGEFHSLTPDEITRLARLSVEEVGAHQTVLVSVGGELGYAMEMARMAQEVGASAILVQEPSHTFASAGGLSRYYRELSRSVSIGVAIYKRSNRLPDPVIAEVAHDCENVVAIKYAVNDVAAYLELVERVGDDAVCACGTAERWALPFAIAGTTGFTSGIANFAPDAVTDYWQALKVSPIAAATRQRWSRFAAIERMRARDGAALNVPVIKAAMELCGLAAGALRPPLAAITDAEAEELRPLLQAVHPLPERSAA